MPFSDSAVVRSIVLIDDDTDFLHVMQRRLQAQRPEYAPSSPVESYTFTDPVEALVNMPADGICVVLLDYNLQDSTGLDWLPKFLKCGLGPVILLTNHNDSKLAAEAFRAGAADYIAKSEVIKDGNYLGGAIREAVHRYRLETRNILLTRQLKVVNLELEGKNKRLSELTQTAHQVVDDVAHDFRTPLTVIQQYASIIADGLGDPVTARQCEYLGVITEATQDLSEMVDDFLDSSKLRAKALSVDRESHTVQELFDSAVKMLEVRAAPKKISVEAIIAPDVTPYFADISKVIRILTNVAVNAIKVTSQGGALQLWARMTDSGDVRIGVTDQGPGLTPEDLKVIFERFQQLTEPQASGTKGFGLGLSIVKHLTWLNLGKVEVQSEPGKGSTFAFTLPAFDLPRILSCYCDNVRSLEEPGDFWMLHIRSLHETLDPITLRKIVAGCCYPMDLVILDTADEMVNALGVSRDPNAWMKRLRREISRFSRPTDAKEAFEVDITTKGPWLRDSSDTKLLETLLPCFGTGSCCVETSIANR